MDISGPSAEKKPKLSDREKEQESVEKDLFVDRNGVQTSFDSFSNSEYIDPRSPTVADTNIIKSQTGTSAGSCIKIPLEELKNIEHISAYTKLMPPSCYVLAQTSAVTGTSKSYVSNVQPLQCISSESCDYKTSQNVPSIGLTDIAVCKQYQLKDTDKCDNVLSSKEQLLKHSPLRKILEKCTDVAKHNTPAFAINDSSNVLHISTLETETEKLENHGSKTNSAVCVSNAQINFDKVCTNVEMANSKINKMELGVHIYDRDSDEQDMSKMQESGDHVQQEELHNGRCENTINDTGDNEITQKEKKKMEVSKKDSVTPTDFGRELRKSRRRTTEVVQCPVCRIQVKISEFFAHYELEIARMEKWRNDYSKKNKKRLSYTSNSSTSMNQTIDSREGSEEEEPMDHEQRYKAFVAVRRNREKRKRRANHSRGEGTECPVCNKRIMGNQQEVNRHVNFCLVKEDADVDIEGSDAHGSDKENTDEDNDISEQYEEYEWAGQTRIRATSMIAGSFAESGFTVGQSCTDEEVGELNIEEDETDIYGKSQYNEADLIPCAADEPEEEKERQAIRNVLLQNEGQSCSSSQSHDSTKWSTSQEPIEEMLDTGQEEERTSRSKTIECLERKLKDLRKELDAKKSDKYKCLICMETYDCPVTSIQCWHVYCEECWLRTLGAKKLCPQCNMITHPSDLRKIYL